MMKTTKVMGLERRTVWHSKNMAWHNHALCLNMLRSLE